MRRRSTEEAAEVIDATGLLVTPGFVDPHTHYDAQLFWDPRASPSNVHGVTTVIGGNCGFTLAPLRAEDADYTAPDDGQGRGHAARRARGGRAVGLGDLRRLPRRGSRATSASTPGSSSGHCALRRYVMGADAVGNEASADQLDEMQRVLAESLEAGGLGFSTTLSRTHSDGDGEPVASRWATTDELLALCRVVGEHEGTTLEGMTDGCLDRFSDDEIDLFATMSAAAAPPAQLERADHRLRGARARAPPARLPTTGPPSAAAASSPSPCRCRCRMNMSFLNYCALFLIPGWGEILAPAGARAHRQAAGPRDAGAS